MLGIANPWAFVLAAALVILVPGPATFFVASRAHHSTQHAGRATAGIVAGDVVLITLSGAGFSALVTQWPLLLSAIKIGGALYVGYLGAGLLRAPAPAGDIDAPGGGFVQGLLLTLTNPKPILFFGAFFPLFIDRATASWMVSFYALGGVFEAINLLYFAALILLVAKLRRAALFQHWAAGRIHRVSGYGLMLCAGLILASALG